MHRLVTFGCRLLLVLAPAVATAQNPLGDEEQILQQLGRGQLGKALDGLLTLAESNVGSPGPDQERAALTEYAAMVALELAPWTSTPGAARVQALRQSPLAASHPELDDRLAVLLLQASLQNGWPQTATLAREQGCLLSFWIAGPFDNERGSGFKRTFEPERALDLQAPMPGKQRPVSWRRLDLPPTTGSRFDLDAVLRPREQVLCYAAVALVAEGEGPAVLHLGSTGPFRVLCNGAEVLARDVHRRLCFDQDAALLPLQKGPNLLLLKVCHEHGSEFAFTARLRLPDGRAADGVRASTEPEDLRRAATVRPVEGKAGTPSQGARTWLQAAAAKGSAAAAFRLARMLLILDADGDGERRDRLLAAQAREAMPKLPAARTLQADTLERSARGAAERDENSRRHAVQAALELDPDYVPALTRLGRLDFDGARLLAPAEAAAARALRICPDHATALLLQADILEAKGMTALAACSLQPHAPGSAPLRRRLAALLDESIQQDAVLQLRQSLCEGGGTLFDRLALVRALQRRGRADDALRELEQAQALWPLQRSTYEARARALQARGDLPAALREWTRWLQLCPDDDAALLAISTLHGAAGERPAQIESLQAALELNPNLREPRRYLEYLSAEQTPFYQPYRIDGAAVLAADAGPPADATAAADALHHLLQQRVVQAHRNGTTSEYRHTIVRVLTEAGARELQSLNLPHYRGEQRARWLQASVRKAEGSVQQPALRGASLQLPSLRPGDVVDAEGRIDDLAPTFFGDSFGLQHLFMPQDGAPCARSALVVIAEPGREYRTQSGNGAPEPQREQLADGTLVLRWEMSQLPRDGHEPQRPAPAELEPLCRVTTWRDWDHFASWWSNLIRRQTEVTEAMQKKVKELTAASTTDQERIAALYRFVTTDVRYEAWEFGVHGYKPYSTAVIFERAHGDCKDKALLLCALLAEVGVHAAPVLIRADELRTRDDLTLPLVSQFNHCIVWVAPAEGRPGRFLDGTATWHPTDTLPEMDQGAEVLVVDGGKAELRPVPWCAPEGNATVEELELDVRRDGSAMVRMQQRPRGNAAVGLRAELAATPALRNESTERALVRRFGPSVLKSLQASDPLQLEQPIQLTTEFEARAIATRDQQALLLKSAFGLHELGHLAALAERRAPLLLGSPSTERQLLRYRLPPGLRPEPLPAPVSIQAEFGSFHLQWQQRGDQLEVERVLTFTAPRITPRQYGAFRDFAAVVKEADGRLLVLREGGR